MPAQPLIGLSIVMRFVPLRLLSGLALWPNRRLKELHSALVPLVIPHTFRFIGLSFLVPGVVSPALPAGFAAPAAYGDLIAALLAIVSLVALYKRMSFAIVLVWVLNVWGTGDFLFLLSRARRRPARSQNAR